MSFNLASLRSSRDDSPPRVLIYGPPGVGKTTFACSARKAVLLPTDEGAGQIDVPSFPLARDYQNVLDAIGALYNEDHDHEVFVIDDLSSLEPLIWQAVCQHHNAESIEKVLNGYGKGYVETDRWWSQLLEGFNALRTERGMAVVLIAHADIKRYEDPRVEAYDRYTISLHKRAVALLQKHVDVIGFAGYRVTIKKEESGGFTGDRARGVGSGERLLSLEERPAFIAKNRYSMPAEIPLSWEAFAAHVPPLAARAATTTPAPADQPEQETADATA